jgi:hypothetical protein
LATILKLNYRRSQLVVRGLLLVLGPLTIGAIASCGGAQRGALPKPMKVDVAPGAVIVDILGAGRPEHYWQYQVQPSAGVVRTVLKTEFKDYTEETLPTAYQQPAGAGACTEHKSVPSPDGRFVAQCESDGLQINYRLTSTIAYTWKSGRDIRGIAWSPNSRSLAVLSTSERLGKAPIELLSALSGHPVPHNTVFLSFIDFEASSVTEYRIQEDVVSAFCRILDWSL